MPKLLGQSNEQMEMTCRLAATGRKSLVYISMNRWKREKCIAEAGQDSQDAKSLEHFDEKMKRSNQTYATYF